MTVISRIKKFLFGDYGPIDDFEQALINYVAEKLDVADRTIFKDQVSRFNNIYRDDEILGEKKKGTYFYWKERGKNRRDFPLKFRTNKSEEKLAKLIIKDSENTIEVNFWLVDGVFFSIDFISEKEQFRPYTPFFDIELIEIFSEHKR